MLLWCTCSYDDPDLEMENWVEPGRPRNEDEKARDFIKDHKIFEIWPKGGELEQGARTNVRITYNPKHTGGMRSLLTGCTTELQRTA